MQRYNGGGGAASDAIDLWGSSKPNGGGSGSIADWFSSLFQIPSWSDIGDAALAAMPKGTGSMANLMLNGDTMTPSEKGRAAAGVWMGPAGLGIGPVLAGMDKLVGTPAVQREPFSTWAGMGNDPSTHLMDDLLTQGGIPKEYLDSVWDALQANRNAGGAYDPNLVENIRQGFAEATKAGAFAPGAPDSQYGYGPRGSASNPSGSQVTQQDLPPAGWGGGGTAFETHTQPPNPDTPPEITPAPNPGPVSQQDLPPVEQPSGDSGGGDWTSGFDSWGQGDMGFYSAGGVVLPPRIGAPNPPGPDDQVAALQSGEGVVNRRGMQALGPRGLAALNSGKPLSSLAQMMIGAARR
jgi:hypothetical protein